MAPKSEAELELGCAPRRYHARMAAEERLVATQFHAPRTTAGTGAAAVQLVEQYVVDKALAQVAAAKVAEEMARAAEEMVRAAQEFETAKAAEEAKRAEAVAAKAAAVAAAVAAAAAEAAVEPSCNSAVDTTPRRSARGGRGATPASVAAQPAAANVSVAAKAKTVPVTDVAVGTPRQRVTHAATPTRGHADTCRHAQGFGAEAHPKQGGGDAGGCRRR